MSQEKHRYSRVAASLQAWLRPLPSAEAPALLGNASEMFGSSAPANLQDARLSEAMIQFMLDMDRKLQAILGLLGRDQMLQDFPIQATTTEIGGDGAHLLCQDELLPHDGGFLEIVVALNPMPLRLAGAVGRISERLPVQDGRPEICVFEFTRIRESEQDAIIGFVLQEERRHIRERKWD